MNLQWLNWMIELPFLASVLLKMTLFLSLAWVLHVALRRANPRWRVLLWRGVAVGLTAIPVLAATLPSWKVAVAPLRPGTTAQPSPPGNTVTPSPAPQAPLPSSFPSSSSLPSLPATRGYEPASHRQPEPPEVVAPTATSKESSYSLLSWVRGHLTWVCVGVWAAGVLALSLRFFLGWWRIRRTVKAAMPAPGEIQNALSEIAREMNISRQIQPRLCENIPSPFLTGLRRPCLILPSHMTEPPYSRELRPILVHELSHLRSHDLFWGYILRWLCVVLWFHPFVWRIHRAHASACEQVSDALTADFLGDAKGYSQTLARVALDMACRPPAIGGIPMARLSDISRRLKALKRRVFTAPLRRRSLVVSLASGLLAVGLLSGLRLAHSGGGEGHAAAKKTESRIAEAPAPSQAGAESKSRERAPSLKRPETGQGSRVQGIVVDEEGKPVQGAVVNAVGRWRMPTGATSGADGTFVLNIDSPTLSYVTIVASADHATRQGFYEFEATQDSATPTPIRILLRPSLTVEAEVVDAEAKPVSDAAVEVMAWYEPLAHGTTDAEGLARVKFPAEAKVDWVIALKSAVGFDYYENYATRQLSSRPGDLPRRVKLVLDGARHLRIKALDSANKPVPGVGFTPWLIQKKGKNDQANLSGSELATVRTDAGGVAIFDWIPRNMEEEVPFVFHERDYHCPEGPELWPSGDNIELTARLLRNTRISGKVFLPDGKPAEGILIQAQGEGDKHDHCRTWARTAADGSYIMTDIFPNLSYIVAVVDDAWAAPSHTGIMIREDRPRDNLDFHLTRGTAIRGKVTLGPDHKPVIEKTVTLVQNGAELPKEWSIRVRPPYERERLARSTKTDDQGRYAFRAVAGEYSLSVMLGPGQSQRQDLTVGTEEEIVQDFHFAEAEELRRVELTGIVLDRADKSNPVAGAKVTAIPEITDDSVRRDFQAVAGASGRFTTERFPANCVLYAASPDGTLAGTAWLAKDDKDVEIYVSPAATAAGRIVDDNGKPLPNQKVRCELIIRWNETPAGGGLGGATHYPVLRTLSDEDGRFSLAGLPVGARFNIAVIEREDAIAQRELEVTQPGIIEVPDIVVGKADTEAAAPGSENSGAEAKEPTKTRGQIRGVVVNADTGEPIAGAYVAVDHSGDAGGANLGRFREEGIYATTETDQTGRFLLDGVAFHDNHPFMATHPGFVRHQETIALKKDQPEIDIRVRLRPAATLVAKIVDSDGKLLEENAILRLEAEDGRPFFPMKADWPDLPYRTETTKTGTFSFGELDTGVFSIEAMRLGNMETTYHARVSNIAVKTGERKEVLMRPADHRSTINIKIGRDPHASLGERKGAAAVLLTAKPGLLAWANRNFYHPEDERLGRVWKSALLMASLMPVEDADTLRKLEARTRLESPSEEGNVSFFLGSEDMIYTLRNFPPGEYAVFTFAMGMYGEWKSPAVYLRGANAVASPGKEQTIVIPYVEPIGPSPTNARTLYTVVNLEARAYTAQEICELLLKETGAKGGEIVPDSSIEREEVVLPPAKLQIWDLLETIYLKKGWRLEADFEAKRIVLRASAPKPSTP